MVTGLSDASVDGLDAHVRPLDAWRDGSAVADLLELAFRDEGIDDNGQRMIRMLRNFGPLELLTLEGANGFVWVDNDQVIGNASIQRNPTRHDTWIIGNVAAHPAHRNRGIGSALVAAVIDYARMHGARYVALQVVEGNAPAMHIYEKLGFRPTGAVTYYRRPALRMQPNWRTAAVESSIGVRSAQWRDREVVWRVTRCNVPDELTYAEPFDQRVYQLGLRWSLANWLNGNREQWLVGEVNGQCTGAVRTRVNFELSEHHVELMLDQTATPDDGVALLDHALKRFEIYLSKPLMATQSRPHERSHAALQAAGFKPTRTLLHMTMEIGV